MEVNSLINQAVKALEWCEENPGWVRICDIPSEFYEDYIRMRWSDIDAGVKRRWIRAYGIANAQRAWEELAIAPSYRVPSGAVDDQGNFLTLEAYRKDMGSAMMVFKIA